MRTNILQWDKNTNYNIVSTKGLTTCPQVSIHKNTGCAEMCLRHLHVDL